MLEADEGRNFLDWNVGIVVAKGGRKVSCFLEGEGSVRGLRKRRERIGVVTHSPQGTAKYQPLLNTS